MNKTKIEWADMTWNPVTGCLHKCEFCYARRIAERFGTLYKGPLPEDEGLSFLPDEPERFMELDEPARDEAGRVEPYPANFYPTLHRYKLDEPQRQKKPQTIFVCSMADLFGDWVPDEWIKAVFNACKQAPQHTYMFLTKDPKRYIKLARYLQLPANQNFWYGSTITNNKMPIFTSEKHNCFISVEPLLEELEYNRIGDLMRVDWIIIGAMTGPGSKYHQPECKWIKGIVKEARKVDIPIFMKDSLAPIWGSDLIREYPSIMVREGKKSK